MPPSECPEEHELLAVLDGADSARGAADHVAGCSECRRRLDYLQAGMTRLSNVIAWSSGGPAVVVGPTGSRGDVPTFLGRFFVAGVVDEDEGVIVYRGAHALVHTEVLMVLAKQPLLADAATRQPLLAKGKRLMACSHPQIARVLDLDFDGNRPFLVTEHVAGSDLATYLADLAPGLEERVRLIASVADAVATLHEAEVVHGDLRPRNIIIDASGTPHITGLGRAFFGAKESGETDSTVAAPSSGDDLRALGEMLYFVLVGSEPPKSADGRRDIVEIRGKLMESGAPARAIEPCLEALGASSSQSPDVKRWAEKLAGAPQSPWSAWMWWGVVVAGVAIAAIIRKVFVD